MCTHIGLGTRRLIASQEKTQWLEMVTEQIEQTQRNKRTFKIKQVPHKLPRCLWPSLPSLPGTPSPFWSCPSRCK